MLIDRRTCSSLELVSNTCDGGNKRSLFGVINYTKTAVGARLLRAELLQPSAGRLIITTTWLSLDCTTVNMRLEVVEILQR